MHCTPTSAHLGLPAARIGALVAGLVLGGCTALSIPGQRTVVAGEEGFRGQVYAGATVGNSHLTPDTSGTRFDVDENDDVGTQIRLGADLHRMLAVELETSVLGTATLREAGTDVSYSAATLSALLYGFNGIRLRSHRESWSAYGRLGVGVLKKSSAVAPLEDGGTGPVIGAGVEYGLPSGLGIRGEITRFADDALYAGIGAIYRFGLTPREVGGLIAEIAEPVLGAEETRVAEDGRSLERGGRFGRVEPETIGGVSRVRVASTAVRRHPSVHVDDRDRDGVRDGDDRCPDTATDVTVDRAGCGLFDTVLSDVVFGSGSHRLTARARGALDDFAERLLAFPEVRVRVLAHTDSSGTADDNLALSVRRADAVIQYLVGRGIAELQLEGRGLGEILPRASNRDAVGRARNRRIEIETLSDLDAEQLARGGTSRNERAGKSRPASSAPRSVPVAPPATVARTPPIPSPNATAAENAVPSPSVETADPAPITIADGAGIPPVAPSSKPDPAPAVDSRSADDGAASDLWRGRYEPAFAGALPAPTAVRAIAAMVDGRPAPLPRPGYVAGLQIVGIASGLRFAAGSAELLPGARPVLAEIADELREHPEARIAIMAHTDDLDDAADDLALSVERAASVLEGLVELGVERPRLVAKGYGRTLPLVQSVTSTDRARNRRVELRVLR